MNKRLKQKGVAISEYVLIAVLFAVTLGIAVHQIGPEVLRNYFINTSGGAYNDGTLTVQPMGE